MQGTDVGANTTSARELAPEIGGPAGILFLIAFSEPLQSVKLYELSCSSDQDNDTLQRTNGCLLNRISYLANSPAAIY